MLRWAKNRERQPSCLEDVVLGADLAGKSVLHIGCSTGDLCRRALENGAASVTGIDLCRQKIDEARALSSAPREKLNFIAADFEQWDAPSQAFHIVACSNILHHLYEPVAAVRKIMRLSGERFGVMAKVDPPVGGHGPSALRRLLESRDPARISLGERKMALRATDQTFMLSRRALEIIINRHSKAFEDVKFRPVSGGYVVEARRRRINHLVVVAGVAASGKSRLIARLVEPAMQHRFGVDPPFETVKPEEIDRLASGRHDTVILHYDLLRPFDRPLEVHERDPSFHLLQSARRITFITVAQSSDVLLERMHRRDEVRRNRNPMQNERAAAKSDSFARPGFLSSWYEAWLDATAPYTGRAGDRSFFLLADGDYTDLRDRKGLLEVFEPSKAQRKRPSAAQVLSLAIAAAFAPMSGEAEAAVVKDDLPSHVRAIGWAPA